MTALEGTYEYECMRAELLGIEKPDYEEFMKNKDEEVGKEALEAETLREVEGQKEYFQKTSGKFEELGNILKSTQKKINILTTPFSVYLKSKIGKAGSSKESQEEFPSEDKVPTEEIVETDRPSSVEISRNDNKDTLNSTMDQIPLIDRLIIKCEDNTYAMQHQIKQMKRLQK